MIRLAIDRADVVIGDLVRAWLPSDIEDQIHLLDEVEVYDGTGFEAIAIVRGITRGAGIDYAHLDISVKDTP